MEIAQVAPQRSRALNQAEAGDGPIVYAMARDQRVMDNWAFLNAQQIALEQHQPLVVICPVNGEYPEPPLRQATLMLDGLRQVERAFLMLNVPLLVATNKPHETLLSLLGRVRAGTVVTDFSPLRTSRQWKTSLAEVLAIPVIEVDAHNIVPCWVASPKQEYAAYTFRPKINRLLGKFLTDFPAPVKHPFSLSDHPPAVNWKRVMDAMSTDNSVPPAPNFKAGTDAAFAALQSFLENRLSSYAENRNDPNSDAQSGLSPYLHFGQISAQRVALETQRFDEHVASQEAFLEELIVRRELADNFCFYNANYDTFAGFSDWAQNSLNQHRTDPRSYLYSRDELEAAATHDTLWNAAQTEMVVTGKMHGYLRMYWAKKLLEWSLTPQEALATALYLNDKYELDGRDPNGYSGVAWSIGGVHDRPWFERDIFGKVRYMSERGCRGKFDVPGYVKRIQHLRGEIGA
jgi:deoxyribodipyrimidine photo-lyase